MEVKPSGIGTHRVVTHERSIERLARKFVALARRAAAAAFAACAALAMLTARTARTARTALAAPPSPS
ncbi:MAG: hypothetical protein JNL85_02495 [Rubrivivax sp.]|nr:hypothetical protein [Rubrivivax sp.]